MIVVVASEVRRDTCRDEDTSPVQVIEAEGLSWLAVSLARVLCQRLHVKTGDSSSWTSLSIWMRILTVISSSALRVVLVSIVVET